MARRPTSAGNGVGKVMEMLTEHSVEYVDLRFDGKVYLKKKGEAPK